MMKQVMGVIHGVLDGLNCGISDPLEPRDRHFNGLADLTEVPSRSRQPMNFLQPDRFMASLPLSGKDA